MNTGQDFCNLFIMGAIFVSLPWCVLPNLIIYVSGSQCYGSVVRVRVILGQHWAFLSFLCFSVVVIFCIMVYIQVHQQSQLWFFEFLIFSVQFLDYQISPCVSVLLCLSLCVCVLWVVCVSLCLVSLPCVLFHVSLPIMFILVPQPVLSFPLVLPLVLSLPLLSAFPLLLCQAHFIVSCFIMKVLRILFSEIQNYDNGETSLLSLSFLTEPKRGKLLYLIYNKYE